MSRPNCRRRSGAAERGARFAGLCLALVGAQPSASEATPALPGVRLIDVGQGAAMLVQSEAGQVLLIDSGPASGAEAIVGALALHKVTRVDLWVHTHFDADHVGGVGRVIQGADGVLDTSDDVIVAAAWDRGTDEIPDTDAVAVYFALLGERRSAPTDEQTWSTPGLRVRALRVDPDPAIGSSVEENQRGLALCVEIGSTRLLAPGDLPAAQVAEAARKCGPVDLLWASHHGSDDGTSAAVLELARPHAVVISAGRDNPYCHPSPRTLALLDAQEVWSTGGAGVWGAGPCGALARDLTGDPRIVGGDLYFPLDPENSS